MTEAEWLACDDPVPMLDLLCRKVSDRKRRLFAAADCRRIWRMLSDERSRQAVEVGERYADGIASEQELQTALANGRAAYAEACERYNDEANRETKEGLGDEASQAAAWAAAAAGGAAEVCLPAAMPLLVASWRSRLVAGVTTSEETFWCRMLHDLAGNPFRPVAFAPSWRSADATALAFAIYADRAFDRLPILADALEDAGCTDRAVLDHCRQPGEHVRGCWVVDLALGKE